MPNALELRQKRAALVAEARAILEAAEKETRDLTTEETEKYDRIMAEVDKLAKDIEREERLANLERELAQPQGTVAARKEQPGDGQEQRANPRATKEYRDAFNGLLRRGLKNLTNEEYRALQAASDVGGGFTVVPEQFIADLMKAVDNEVYIRQLATIIRVEKADSLGVPVLDTDVDDADWTSELRTGSEDSAMAFGKRALRPHPLAKRIKVSNDLLRKSALDIEALVRDRLAYKFGVSQEKAFLTGNGSDQPLGVFVASPQGISTARDVSDGNLATSITADGLINAKFALKPQYWRGARWLFHRDVVKQIRKLKDGDGNYLWQPGLTSTRPDTILDAPYLMSEYAPNTFASGQYVGILGDFKFYWIADALDMSIQVLDQLYAETNQTGYIGRLACDGMPVMEEAFVRVKLA